MKTLFDELETEDFKWFNQYHKENPQIYEYFKRYTFKSISQREPADLRVL